MFHRKNILILWCTTYNKSRSIRVKNEICSQQPVQYIHYEDFVQFLWAYFGKIFRGGRPPIHERLCPSFCPSSAESREPKKEWFSWSNINTKMKARAASIISSFLGIKYAIWQCFARFRALPDTNSSKVIVPLSWVQCMQSAEKAPMPRHLATEHNRRCSGDCGILCGAGRHQTYL